MRVSESRLTTQTYLDNKQIGMEDQFQKVDLEYYSALNIKRPQQAPQNLVSDSYSESQVDHLQPLKKQQNPL